MSIDLGALAQRVARELALADTLQPLPATRHPLPETAGRGTAGTGEMDSGQRAAGSEYTKSSAPAGVRFVRDQARIADFIDHTVLKAEATAAEIDTLCDEARKHRFAAVCVNPVWVPRCAARLSGAPVAVATVIGFPLGANSPALKAIEASRAVSEGATELDMVAAIGQVKSGNWGAVADDIAAVVEAARGTLVKVIIESAVLSPVEIVKVCALARESGAQYVKTSTGFHSAGGATAEAVALMRLVVGDALGVKASGGVRDCATALKMIGAGATRIGTSSGVAMTECLGAGPLPLAELLASPHTHTAKCSSGACSHEPPPAPNVKSY